MSRSRSDFQRSLFSLGMTGLALVVLPFACQADGAPEEITVATGALTSIRLAGHVATGQIGVPAVTVQLNGQSQATALTDADGNFKFDISAGSYSLFFSKSGATFNGPFNLNNLTTSTFVNATCNSGCSAPSDVIPARELVITDPLVVGDPRSDNATTGRWSFRFLMQQMSSTNDETNMTIGWMDSQLAHGGTVNNFTVDPRDTSKLNWPIQFGTLNWANCPFHLKAIVNRTDLHSTGAGELRFVYGTDASMTVIFEYKLPPTRTRQGWVSQFHGLSNLTPGSSAYNAALQAITDQVVVKGALAGGPNGGSAISQVRVNEIQINTATSPNWQLREFHLQNGGILVLSQTAQTPDDSAITSGTTNNATLASFINGNIVNLQGGFATVPSGIVGGQSSEADSWTHFSVAVDSNARHAFAGQTCSGCHFSEINGLNTGGFYHISPSGQLSPFITAVEIPRRAIFAKNQLTCQGSGCAVGAEPMVP